MKSKKLLLPIVAIVLAACCVVYLYLSYGISISETRNLFHLDDVSIDDDDPSLLHHDVAGNGHFINPDVIPFHNDTLTITPWSPIHLDIPSLINTLHDKNISTVESMDFITLPPGEARLENVMWDNQVPSHYMSCSNLSLNWDYPIGVPSLPMNSTSYFHDISHDNLDVADFNQMIDFDALCYVHTPGFFADNTVFNRDQWYSFTYQWMGNYQCWDNKTMDFLCDTTLSSCSKEGTSETVQLQSTEVRVLNIGFRITGWGATAFSHFHIFAVPQFAMIYGLLVEWKQHSIAMMNGTAEIKLFYNISIVTHTNTKKEDIIPWFWRQFGLKPRGTTMVTQLMNITIIPSKSWCRSSFTNIHYSPMLISPYYLRYKANYDGQIRMRWKMLARNSMLNIKPFISNLSAPRNVMLYMSRGTGKKRGVKNNGDVVRTLKDFVNGNQDRLPFEMEYMEFGSQQKHLTRDQQKQFFSRVAVMIGPHGGAFANENLMQPGSFVVEFIDWWTDSNAADNKKKKKFRPCYYALAQAGGMHYYMVKPDNFDWDNGAMTINIDNLLTVMNAVYDRMSSDGFKYAK